MAYRTWWRVPAVHRLSVTLLLLAFCAPNHSLDLYAAEISSLPFTGVSLTALPLEPSVRHKLEMSLKVRDYAGAEGTLVRAVSEHPNQPLLYTYLGRLFFVDHKYLNTAIAIKKAEALQPLEERDRFTLAMAYVEIGHPDWARPELEKLTQFNPRNPLYPYWQGRLDYDRQDPVAATVQFQKVIALDADYMKAYDNLGLCLEGLGKYDEAIEQYRRAIQLNRERHLDSSWPPLDLGALLIKLDRLDEAQPLLKESLQFNPDFAQAHYQLGVLMEKHNDVTSALQELKRAAVLDEADPQAHYVLARVYRRAGNDEQSKQELQIFQSLKSKEFSPRSE